MDFRGEPGLKTSVKNDNYWSKIGSAFGEPGGTPPPEIPPRYPPFPHPRYPPQGQGLKDGRITKAGHFNMSINVKLEILCYLNRIIHSQ